MGGAGRVIPVPFTAMMVKPPCRVPPCLQSGGYESDNGLKPENGVMFCEFALGQPPSAIQLGAQGGLLVVQGKPAPRQLPGYLSQ